MPARPRLPAGQGRLNCSYAPLGHTQQCYRPPCLSVCLSLVLKCDAPHPCRTCVCVGTCVWVHVCVAPHPCRSPRWSGLSALLASLWCRQRRVLLKGGIKGRALGCLPQLRGRLRHPSPRHRGSYPLQHSCEHIDIAALLLMWLQLISHRSQHCPVLTLPCALSCPRPSGPSRTGEPPSRTGEPCSLNVWWSLPAQGRPRCISRGIHR